MNARLTQFASPLRLFENWNESEDEDEFDTFSLYDPYDFNYHFKTSDVLLQQDIVDGIIGKFFFKFNSEPIKLCLGDVCDAVTEEPEPALMVHEPLVIEECSIPHPKADIFFVLDGSFSTRKSGWKEIINFVKVFVKVNSERGGNINYGLLQYSDTVESIITLDNDAGNKEVDEFLEILG